MKRFAAIALSMALALVIYNSSALSETAHTPSLFEQVYMSVARSEVPRNRESVLALIESSGFRYSEDSVSGVMVYQNQDDSGDLVNFSFGNESDPSFSMTYIQNYSELDSIKSATLFDMDEYDFLMTSDGKVDSIDAQIAFLFGSNATPLQTLSPYGIDLKSMTDQELSDLYDAIVSEYRSRHPQQEEAPLNYTIPQGSYVVGHDLNSGYYSLSISPDGVMSSVQILKSAGDQTIGNTENLYLLTPEEGVGKTQLKDGNVVVISGSTVTFIALE